MPDTDLEHEDLENIADNNDEADIEGDQETDNLDDEGESTDGEDTTDDEQSDEELEVGDAIVTLPDGSEMTVSEIAELQAGGLRLADYTAKSTDVSKQRRAAEAAQLRNVEQDQFLQTTMQKFLGFVQKIIPPEPDLSLAQSDPGQYQYQKAIREAALAEINQITQIQGDVDTQAKKTSEDELGRYKQDQDAQLVMAMPHLSDPVKRSAFDKSVKAAAVKDFGFTEDEAANTHDARVLQVIHYAIQGKKAVKNRANAKRRVETPKTGKAKASRATNMNGSQEAMQRLSKSGSVEDAVAALSGS